MVPRLVAVIGLVTSACRGNSPPKQAPANGPTIEIVLDGAAPHAVLVDRPIALATLLDVPPAKWIEVRADASDQRWLELTRPETSYRGDEVRLYLDHGRPAIGVFPPVTSDMPPQVAALARQPVASLSAVVRVEILTRFPDLPPLRVIVDGSEVPISSDQLRALPDVSERTVRAHGWALADVVALAAPAGDVHAVHVRAAGESLTFDDAALRDPGKRLLLRTNQHGQYVFRVWDVGARYPTRELRGVTELDLD